MTNIFPFPLLLSQPLVTTILLSASLSLSNLYSTYESDRPYFNPLRKWEIWETKAAVKRSVNSDQMFNLMPVYEMGSIQISIQILSGRELKFWEHPNVWVGERRRWRDQDHSMETMARSLSHSQRSYHYPHGRDGCTDSWHWVGYRTLNPHTECLWCILWWRVFPSEPLRSCMQLIPGSRLYVREMETNIRTISTTINLGNKEDWILWSSAWTLEFEPQLYPSQLYDCVQIKHTRPLRNRDNNAHSCNCNNWMS